jgi:hypothetical protein
MIALRLEAHWDESVPPIDRRDIGSQIWLSPLSQTRMICRVVTPGGSSQAIEQRNTVQCLDAGDAERTRSSIVLFGRQS